MNQDPYVAFVNAKGNAFTAVTAWLGSALGPIYIFIGWGEYSDWPLYVGIGLTIYVLLSIRKGFKALNKGIRTDFIVYSVIPLLIPLVTVVIRWFYNA